MRPGFDEEGGRPAKAAWSKQVGGKKSREASCSASTAAASWCFKPKTLLPADSPDCSMRSTTRRTALSPPPPPGSAGPSAARLRPQQVPALGPWCAPGAAAAGGGGGMPGTMSVPARETLAPPAAWPAPAALAATGRCAQQLLAPGAALASSPAAAAPELGTAPAAACPSAALPGGGSACVSRSAA
jgi:hypothetical protein